MNILVVDDEPLQRSILSQFLKEQGFSVLEAENGTQAIEIFRNQFCPLVLLDHKMPGMTGDQVLEQLRQMNPMVQVIMITAYGEIDMAVNVMKLGAIDFLEKPVDLELLLQKVESAVSKIETEEDIQEVTRQIEQEHIPLTFIGKSPGMKEAVSTARRVADTPWPVLLYGETGTGKELMARLVHELSPRKNAEFAEVNCAAIPENLFESELFGHRKGAFTGATKDKKGLFEFAQGGTIFLDEIGEMPEHLQAKMLRVLQEQKMTPVGSLKPVKVDVRIIAATNRDLKLMIEQGLFRQDLYFRLNVFEIHLPPLRERKEDIPELITLFLEKYRSKPIGISSEALD
ncbi:MAG: two-component system response regulator, partial [Thermodesulfatator sp.]